MKLIKPRGSHKSLPHYSVHGIPTEFYVWVNEDGYGSASKWIKGHDAFIIWHDLSKIKKDDEFIEMIKIVHEKYKKAIYG